MDEQIGRINIITDLGVSGDQACKDALVWTGQPVASCTYDALYSYGARSITVWDASGALVADRAGARRWAAILAGALFSFTISFDDITATLFWATAQNQTVPVKIFSMLRLSISPEINALGTVMIILTIVTPLLAGYLSRKLSRGT